MLASGNIQGGHGAQESSWTRLTGAAASVGLDIDKLTSDHVHLRNAIGNLSCVLPFLLFILTSSSTIH